MTTRLRLSTRQRLECFESNKGICHLCEGRITVGQRWEISHDIPLELGGADDASNWKVAHFACHRAHTAKVDVPNIARAKRREAIAKGAKAPSRNPLPGGRNSSWKRKVNGTVERRT